MDSDISTVRGVRAYPYGPRSEEDVIRARKEVGPDGFITGGPDTPAEWLHWNGAIECGWPGRWRITADQTEAK